MHCSKYLTVHLCAVHEHATVYLCTVHVHAPVHLDTVHKYTMCVSVLYTIMHKIYALYKNMHQFITALCTPMQTRAFAAMHFHSTNIHLGALTFRCSRVPVPTDHMYTCTVYVYTHATPSSHTPPSI
jgi:hypothetical protein